MKKYLILILSLFLININVVKADVRLNIAAPNTIKITDVARENYIDSTYISQTVKTYFKKGNVNDSNKGVYFYCLNKTGRAPDEGTNLKRVKVLGEKFSCFVKEAYGGTGSYKNSYVLNQAVAWNFNREQIDQSYIDTHFNKAGENRINTLINKCNSFTITNPSITITREPKTLVGNYYNVEVNLSYTENYYAKFNGDLIVELGAGKPSNAIITTSATGTSNKKSLDKGTKKFYIRVPKDQMTEDQSFSITVSSDIIKYRAYSYCSDTDNDKICDTGVQKIVPRRLFKTLDTVSKTRTIKMNAAENCAVSANPIIDYDGEDPEDNAEVCGNGNSQTGEKNINLELEWTKNCDDGTETYSGYSGTIGTIKETFDFDVVFPNDTIWAGGKLVFNANLKNTVNASFMLPNDNELIKTPEGITCDAGQNCNVTASEIKQDILDIIESDYNDALDNSEGYTDELYVYVNDENSDNVKALEDSEVEIVSDDVKFEKSGWDSNGRASMNLTKITTIKMKPSYMELRTGKIKYGCESCEDTNKYERFEGVYFTPLKYDDNEFSMYILDSNEESFDGMLFFDAYTSGKCSATIDEGLYECVDDCEKWVPKFYYRQIDLNNPFPNNDYSNTNWKDYYGELNETNRNKIKDKGNNAEYIVNLGDVKIDSNTNYSLSNISSNGRSSLFEGFKIKSNSPRIFKLGQSGSDAR